MDLGFQLFLSVVAAAILMGVLWLGAQWRAYQNRLNAIAYTQMKRELGEESVVESMRVEIQDDVDLSDCDVQLLYQLKATYQVCDGEGKYKELERSGLVTIRSAESLVSLTPRGQLVLEALDFRLNKTLCELKSWDIMAFADGAYIRMDLDNAEKLLERLARACG